MSEILRETGLIEKYKKLGILLVVSGPSGSGKSTILKPVLESYDFSFSVSCTTREPRKGEVHGRDYYFIDRETFRKYIDENLFIEHAEVHNNHYGTLRSEVFSKISLGRNVILDIDIQGARQIKKYAENDDVINRALELVFILPPSLKVLKERLTARGTESSESLKTRLNAALSEIENFLWYDYFIINDDITKAVTEFKNIISSVENKTQKFLEV